MKRMTIEIEGDSGSFDLYLSVEPLGIRFEGGWSCVPGYLPTPLGYYKYMEKGGSILIFDRDLSILEFLGGALDGDAKYPTTIYADLSFADLKLTTEKGMGGKGYVYRYGSAGKKILKDRYFGSVVTRVDWTITEYV